ncbi:thioredoxin family protein [Polaribacter sp. SA4-10]|uniref:thioredoxin family protein n=1 Tax=Polaribacter sp. SA4-10 TaxID=754397 RepID=UPI000B3CF82A|nr:thioredoxin family protein [Polaribacter sp. SA4-10]ARV06794.1 thioredoxin family protein [Polaribacter sp. SA4-10]
MKNSIEKSLENTISYKEYTDLVSNLLAEGKATGPNQSEDLTHYSLLNDKRMKRLNKTTKLSEKTLQNLQKIDDPQTWLLITEGWCGDAAQNSPIINKMAETNKKIDLRVALRDENLELMDLFLTNGGRAIPKLIALDKDNNVLNTWGPRPTVATKMVADYKAEHGVIDAKFKQDLQVWYNKNKGESLQEDFLALFKNSFVREV